MINPRDPSGGERLFYASVNGKLATAPRARELIAAVGLSGGMDAAAAAEAVLEGDLSPLFGGRTLFAGIREAAPGETPGVPGRALPSLMTPSAEPRTAAGFRRELVEATRRCLEGEKTAAISLSGGIDSACVAAAAVELLGAKSVEAFTYEFADSTTQPETPFAEKVCRRLGINHRVVRIDFGSYADSLPEAVWRLEAPRLLSAAWLPMGRAAAAAGHARLLTGYGLELALETPRSFRFIDEICALVPRLPLRGLTLRHWRGRRFEGWPVRRAASLLSPGFEPPFESFYHLVVCLLKSEGLVADAGDFYPSALRELARASASHASEEKGTEGLAERCRRIHFETYFLSRLMGGKAAACREAGAVQSSPALSLNGPHAAQAGEGARLQREAFAREVPAEVSARLKSGSIISAHWSRRLTAALAIPAQEAAERLSNDGSTRGCLLKSYGRQLAALGLWRRIFDAGKIPVEAPSLSSIGLGGLAGR